MYEWLVPPAFAQDPGAPQGGSPLGLLLPVIIILIFYFVLWRPQQRQVREHQAMVRSLQKGDEVVTTGGLHGRITSVEDVAVEVEIAPNVRVRVEKGNVARRGGAAATAAVAPK